MSFDEKEKVKRVRYSPLYGSFHKPSSKGIHRAPNHYGYIEYCPLHTFRPQVNITNKRLIDQFRFSSTVTPQGNLLLDFFTYSPQEEKMKRVHVNFEERGRCGKWQLHQPHWEKHADHPIKDRRVLLSPIRQSCWYCCQFRLLYDDSRISSTRMQVLVFHQCRRQREMARHNVLELSKVARLCLDPEALELKKFFTYQKMNFKVCEKDDIPYYPRSWLCSWDHATCPSCKASRTISVRTCAFYFNGTSQDHKEWSIPLLTEWECLKCKTFILHGHWCIKTGAHTLEERICDFTRLPPSDKAFLSNDWIPSTYQCSQCKNRLYLDRNQDISTEGSAGKGRCTSSRTAWCESCAHYEVILKHNE